LKHLDALGKVFEGTRYRLAAAAIAVAVAPVLAITSNIVSPDGLALNPFADPLRVALVAAIAGAMALNGAILLRNMDMRRSGGGGTTVLGTAAALFTTACPFCQPVWLVWLGLGSATAFLSDVSIYVGVFSLSVLAVSIHYSLNSSENVCEAI
jgi:hypothetical protein